MKKTLRQERVPVRLFDDVADDVFMLIELEYDNADFAERGRILGTWLRSLSFSKQRENLIRQRLSFGGGNEWLNDQRSFEGMIFTEEHLEKIPGKVGYEFSLYDTKGNTHGIPLSELFSKGTLKGDFRLEKYTI